MTASMPTLITYYSRCPHEIDKETGRRCEHPNTRTVKDKPVLIPELDMMRHSLSFECDKGHCWSTSWSTDHVLT